MPGARCRKNGLLLCDDPPAFIVRGQTSEGVRRMADPGGRCPATTPRDFLPVRSSRCASWFGGLLLCAGITSSALAEHGATLEAVETFGEYPITATDAASLRDALRHAPADDADHEASPARTSITLSSRLTLEDVDGGCAWSGPRYRLDMHTLLPQW